MVHPSDHAGRVHLTTHTTADLDEASAILGHAFYANFVDRLPGGEPWRARFSIATAGAVTLGDLHVGTDIRMRCGELGAYHVDVPLSGSLYWRQGNGPGHAATPARGAIFQPVETTTLDRWNGDCRLLSVKISRGALEDHLAGLLDAPVRGPIRFAPGLDLSSGPGAGWRSLVMLAAADMGDPAGLLGHPVVGGRYRENLLTALLLAADHSQRDRLDGHRPRGIASRAVRAVVEQMRADPGHPFTLTGLARTAGVSPRSLQLSFRRHLGVPPMTYLRDLRLGLVHDALRAAELGTTSVGAVAYRYGFPHAGRFAAAYRSRYGVAPSTTLRH